MSLIHTTRYTAPNDRVYKIDIHSVDEPEHPREFMAATLHTWHRRYCISTLPFVAQSNRSRGDYLASMIEAPGHIWSSVYMYDHSGIALSVRPFSCPFDSGWVGFIHISPEALSAIYGTDPHLDPDTVQETLTGTGTAREFAIQLFERELKWWAAWANGEVVEARAVPEDEPDADPIYSGEYHSHSDALDCIMDQINDAEHAPPPEPTFKIMRFYAPEQQRESHPVEGLEGLTRAEAVAHCSSPESCEPGVWFDGFVKE